MADLSLGMPEHTPREETLLELARQLFPAQVRPVLPRIRFGIADTNVILKNIGRDVRDWPRPTRMRILTETGAIRFYVGRHIVEEVEEKIDAWMTARRMDKAVARRIWMEEYLPSLWVVDMGSMHMDDDRVSVLALRDPDDLPTAQLAVLLGQKALSEDKDLAANGLATGEPWLELVLATSSVAWGETVNFGVAAGISVSAQSVAGTVAAVRSVAETAGGKRAITIAGAIAILLILAALILREAHAPSRRWIDEKVRTGADTLASGGKVVVVGYLDVSRNRMRGETVLRGGIVTQVKPPSLTESLARRLAASEAPVSTRDLAAQAWSYERVPFTAVREMRRALLAVPAFVQVRPDHWQLGRRSALGA